MQIRLLLFFSFLFCVLAGKAQKTAMEIKYTAWDIHALRYYPFTQTADSLMKQIIERKVLSEEEPAMNQYKKTAVDLALNKQFLANGINQATATHNLIYKFAMPYANWLNYARPVRENSPDLNLSLFLSEEYRKANLPSEISAQTPFEWVGTENIHYYLEEWLGEIDLLKERNEVLFLSVQSPLAKKALATYRYFLSSRTEMEGIPVYEIVFFSKKLKEKAFEGYLYISEKDSSLVKAIFTLNHFIDKGRVTSILFSQTPSKKETLIYLGNEMNGCLLIEQVYNRDKQPGDSILSPAQREISGLVEEAGRTRAYSNVKKGLSFLLTNRIGIFRDYFDLGPITQMLSYNYTEGIRLRAGGFTSQKLSKQIAVGGYGAYGMKDKQWKYRGDVVFSPFPTDKIRLTYVKDLNIPGYDLLNDNRDLLFYSVYQSKATNLSLQKIGRLSYEKEFRHRVSFQVNAKYWYDQPPSLIQYVAVNNGISTTKNSIRNTEIGASFRFFPNEKQISIKGKRYVFRTPDIDFKLNHRVGIKGILGSDYNYHITDASLFKSFGFPLNTGSFNLRLSGGKVWNSVPFPLLFVPAGNQSYVFEGDDYNLMRFYEFVTDRFVAGNADLCFNQSPVHWILPKSKIKTHLGMRAIYGSLSGKNNPQLHPELFIIGNGIEPLGKQPYAEVNVGLENIFNFLRVDYVYRLTYGNKGSLFLSTAIDF